MSATHNSSGSRSRPSRARLQADLWTLTEEAITVGIQCGIRRWEKYQPKILLKESDQTALIEHLERELGVAFSDRFVFDDP